MRANRPVDLLERAADHLHAVAELYDLAASLQWTKPRQVESPGGDRPKGSHSDPTADTAIDSRRLQVRQAVAKVDRDAQRLYDEIAGLRTALERAIRGWGDA
jgi:hypothetical protein